MTLRSKFVQLCCSAAALLFGTVVMGQNAISGGGTANFLVKWTGPSSQGNSLIYQTIGNNIGIGTTTPAVKLDVNGGTNIRGKLILFPGSNTPAFSIANTNFKVSNTGFVTFVSGQGFPGTAKVAVSNTFGPRQFFPGGIQVTGGSAGGIYSNFGSFNGGGQSGPVLQVINNSTGFISQPLQIENDAPASSTNFLLAAFGAGSDTAKFSVDTAGDTVASGTKSAALKLSNGSVAKVFSEESTEVWLDDYGIGRLRGGVTTIPLDPVFLQTISTRGYHVFLTPREDCKGLYVTNQTTSSFEVRELGGGDSDVEFDYRVVAHRKGYEKQRLPVAIMPQRAATSVPSQ